MLKKVLYAFFLIVFFASGFFVAGFTQVSQVDEDALYQEGYEKGWSDARQRLYETGASFERINLGHEVKSVFGKIVSIEGDAVKIKIKPVEPLADPDLDERLILVSADTEIIRYVPKSDEEYEAEQQQVSGQGDIVEVSAFKKESVSLSQLKTGMNVVAHAQENIAQEKQFSAQQIVIYN